MKKLSAISTSFGLLLMTLLAVPPVFAAPDPCPEVLNAGVKDAAGTVNANTSVGSIITFLVAFVIIIAVLLALVFIVIGAIQWITSGGDKTKVDSARNHIVAAVLGLIVIAFSFVLINVVITALGLGSLTSLHIPTLTSISGKTNPVAAPCP